MNFPVILSRTNRADLLFIESNTQRASDMIDPVNETDPHRDNLISAHREPSKHGAILDSAAEHPVAFRSCYDGSVRGVVERFPSMAQIRLIKVDSL